MAGGTSERRADGRTRTRLRPGKVLGEDGTFLADCVIVDRSPCGARIRILDTASIPDAFRLLDEARRESFASHRVWHRAGEAGLRVGESGEPLAKRDFFAAAGPYYAVR